MFEFTGIPAHGDRTTGTGSDGCTVPPLGTVAVDVDVVGDGKNVTPDVVVDVGVGVTAVVVVDAGAGADAGLAVIRAGVDTPIGDPPPIVIVGVTVSASNAEDTGPELPPLLANAAAATPPIIAERMKYFLLEDFTL